MSIVCCCVHFTKTYDGVRFFGKSESCEQSVGARCVNTKPVKERVRRRRAGTLMSTLSRFIYPREKIRERLTRKCRHGRDAKENPKLYIYIYNVSSDGIVYTRYY